MRIAMISGRASPLTRNDSVDPDGQGVYVGNLARAVARLGHQVSIYTRRDNAGVPERVPFAPGVEVVNVTAGPPERILTDGLLPFIAGLGDGIARDWARHGLPNIVHAHFWTSGLAGLVAIDDVEPAGNDPIPLVQTFHVLGTARRRHQGIEGTSPTEREWFEASVGQLADGIIATCPDQANELVTLGVQPERIAVAPRGVDLVHFAPQGPREVPGREFRLLAISGLAPRNGTDDVVRALRMLVEDGVDAELLVVGSSMPDSGPDPDIASLQAITLEQGVRDRVHCRGPVSHAQIPELYRSADVVVCTPWHEPCSIASLEAMACGIPVVSARAEGLVDTVADGVTGLRVVPRDPAAMAHAVRRLLEDPVMRRRFGAAGRSRVEHGYSWAHIADITVKAYRRAAGTAPRGLSVLAGAGR